MSTAFSDEAKLAKEVKTTAPKPTPKHHFKTSHERTKLTRNLITSPKEMKTPFQRTIKQSGHSTSHYNSNSQKKLLFKFKSKKISQKKLPRNDSDNESGKRFFFNIVIFGCIRSHGNFCHRMLELRTLEQTGSVASVHREELPHGIWDLVSPPGIIQLNAHALVRKQAP